MAAESITAEIIEPAAASDIEEEKKERQREARHKWYVANSKTINKKAREWRAAHLEQARKIWRESARRRRAANPEKARELTHQWCIANREKLREQGRHSKLPRKKRAKQPCQKKQ